MAIRGQKLDPVRNFKYQMTIGGFPNSSGWSKISGLKESTEPVEYREGTDAARMRQLIGQTSFDNVVCERGLTDNDDLIVWRRLVTDVTRRGQDGTAEGNSLETGSNFIRRAVTIILFDYHGRLGWKWELEEAWPISLEHSEFSGDGNEVVLETCEMVHEGIIYSRAA